MNSRNEIAVELRALSALVAGIDPTTPYSVPDGYFDRFSAGVLSRIAGLQPSPFKVPEGYFEGLAARVLSRVKAAAADSLSVENVSDELAGLSAVVAGISRETPYRLPEGYFEELSPVLTVIRERPAYHVPEEYFEEMSPILSVAGEGSAYRVPEGYFEELPQLIMAKVGQTRSARIVPISRDEDSRANQRVLKGNWWKYSSVAAIAACFLLIFSWPQPATNPGSNKPATADAVTQGLQKVSDQEMEAYLDEHHSFVADPAGNSTGTLDMNEGEVESLLSEASDSDLQQYMEEHGSGEDVATN